MKKKLFLFNEPKYDYICRVFYRLFNGILLRDTNGILLRDINGILLRAINGILSPLSSDIAIL
jgi:hypothetical protein